MSKDKLKNWNEFFVNEEHKNIETREEKTNWIKHILDYLPNEKLERVYKYVEDISKADKK